MIKFHCDVCDQKLGVPPEYAGKKVKCTKCGKAHIVPAGGEEMENKAYGEGYELGMLPEGAVKSDHKKTKEEIEATIERESATLIGHGMIKCPHCGKAVKDSAKLCVNCGEFVKADAKAARRKEKKEKKVVGEPKQIGGLGLAMVGGGIAAVISGAIWAGVVYVTGYELGYVAIGVGLLVGVVMVALAGGQHMTVGIGAAGFAVLGLVVGKLMILQFAVPSLIASELIKMPGIEFSLAQSEMLEKKEFSERVQTVLDRRKYGEEDMDISPLPASIAEEMEKEVQARAKKMTDDEKKKLLIEHMVNPLLESLPFEERLKSMMSFWDLAWLGIAVSTAFSVGRGKE
ncbi:zinc ribbon domain-containing protein [Planctomycetota bacterium]|nr:zinc ribbon domain-containing protein [Planctomycetota bacterium]